MQFTPYYGYKSAVPLEEHELIIDYVVMVPKGTSTADVNNYMATVDDGTPSPIKQPLDETNILVYPNPVSTNIFISNSKEVIKCALINLLGMQIKNLNNDGAESIQLNVEDIANGSYILEITYNTGKTVSHKIVIR
jgi:hypothetical protein